MVRLVSGGSSGLLLGAKSNVGLVHHCHLKLSLSVIFSHCSFTILNLFLYQEALNPVVRCASPHFSLEILGKADKAVVLHVVG